ncbi:MAG: hypothetical protein EOP43_02165 [Sphingobacteriaceae bacterium]|nr:MAG: hypothetical protein EOP43_02165 [Sphingobacteriaceae bacterium]
MNEVFLEIVTAKFTAADFERHKLLLPAYQDSSNLRLVFFNETDYNTYLKELETECDMLLSRYWLSKNLELIDKNKFVIKVLTVLKQEYSKKNHCPC